MNDTIRDMLRIRHDFPFEVGWYDLVSTAVTKEQWQASKFPTTVGEVYGPGKVLNYEEYLEALGKLKPDRLMVYVLWRRKGAASDTVWVQSRRCGASVEGQSLPASNHLAREIFELADEVDGRSAETSVFRPKATNGESITASWCLVHDRATRVAFAAPTFIGMKLVRAQFGGGVRETLGVIERDEEAC